MDGASTTESLSVLVCVLPGRGHVSPTAEAVAVLVADGHRVRVVTGRRYASAFRAVGASVILMGADADFDDSDLDGSFPGRRGLRGLALARHDLRESFVRPIPSRWRTVQAALAEQDVDVVLCDPLFLGAIPLLFKRVGRRPRLYVLGFVPISLPPLAAPGRGHRAREAAMQALMALMTAPVQRLASDTIRTLTGRELPCRFIDWIGLSDGIVAMTSPSFEYPRPDSGVPIHFIGPLTSSTGHHYPTPSWWDDLPQDRPIVHVTQGTVANARPQDLILPAIAALADLDGVVVVATGGAPVPGPVPANVRVADFVPYDELLPRCSLVITNGGYGGVNLALRHGVPLLVVGATEDKRLVAQRVNWSGVGIGLARTTASVGQIRAAARRILTDQRYRARAREVAQEMAALDGPRLLRDLVREG